MKSCSIWLSLCLTCFTQHNRWPSGLTKDKTQALLLILFLAFKPISFNLTKLECYTYFREKGIDPPPKKNKHLLNLLVMYQHMSKHA